MIDEGVKADKRWLTGGGRTGIILRPFGKMLKKIDEGAAQKGQRLGKLLTCAPRLIIS